MEHYDTAKATRVWQRVQSAQQNLPDTQSLSALIAEELEDAATYAQLAKRIGGKEAQTLRLLAQTEHSHASCLKGIYALMTGEPINPTIPPLHQEPTERTLRRCYGREMRCLAQYESRASDPEYGPVFTRLAAQERDHCMTVLELLGRMKKPQRQP